MDRPRTSPRPAVALAVAVALLSCACMPDVGNDPLPAAMEFDPGSEPARLPEPTLLVVDPETGRIDLGRAGVDVAADCATLAPEAVAACEFDTFLESLDGFPTLSPARAPADSALDLATLTVPDDLVVVDLTRRELVSDVVASFDASERWLGVAPASGGWTIGRSYVIAVRGYADGVRAKGGREVVAAVLTYLLKSDQSLTCGAEAPAEITADCAWLQLLGPELGDAEARDALVLLEEHRGRLVANGVWQALNEIGGLPRDEVAAVWTFPIHTNPVIELEPNLGFEPRIDDPRTIRLPVRGDLDPTTVQPYALGGSGTVFLLDLTKLEAQDFAGGVPAFAATVENAGGEDHAIVLAAEADLTPGDLIGVLVTTGVTATDGKPLVPAPVTVLLRASGTLVDAEGHSTVGGVTDADAAELEAGRTDLAALLDDPLFASITGLARKDLAFVYAFPWEPPR